MIIKVDIRYSNYTWMEMMIVYYVKYLFLCNGEYVQFVMNVPEFPWFTISNFLMSVSKYVRFISKIPFL
jgi:hypothetical protein